MDALEAYFLLFIDSLFAGLVFNPKTEFVFHSMDIFNFHNKFIILIIVIAAGTLAIIFNYYFGKIVYKILICVEEQESAEFRRPRRDKSREFFNKYYVLFLLISIWPFGGKFVQLMAGIYGLDLKKVILICVGCKILYYGTILII